jgi:glycosyltransferase involved in cell wall biosynthesis
VATLGDEFNFKIVTLDRDLGEKTPYPGVAANKWVRVGKADVLYVAPSISGLLSMLRVLLSADKYSVVYLNSFFARRFSILAVLTRYFKLCRPRCLVLAPRGEFSPGAIQIKRLRKHLYIKLAGWMGLYENLIWHASSDFEGADIRRTMSNATVVDIAGVMPSYSAGYGLKGRSEVATAMDIARYTQRERRSSGSKQSGALRVVFISRLSRKKNLAGALKMLRGLVGDVSFDIYGPKEDAKYWDECQILISLLPKNIQVRYMGVIEHEKIESLFEEYELFLFPTLGENYGHVICEALVSGCPVLISDQTPWRNLESLGVGWDIPLDEPESFRTILQQCVDGDDEWQTELSVRAMDYGCKHVSDPRIIEANRHLFERAFAWRESYGSEEVSRKHL